MGGNAIESLARAIGYPDEVSSGASSFVFEVDGGRVEAREEWGRLFLTRVLAPAREVDLAAFASYAAGRVLREESVLAYDPGTDDVLLWQDVPASSDGALLRRFFEVFTTSCDWWLARADGARAVSSIPEMVIRP